MGPPLGVVVEEVAVLVVLVRRHCHAVRAAVRRAVDDEVPGAINFALPKRSVVVRRPANRGKVPYIARAVPPFLLGVTIPAKSALRRCGTSAGLLDPPPHPAMRGGVSQGRSVGFGLGRRSRTVRSFPGLPLSSPSSIS